MVYVIYHIYLLFTLFVFVRRNFISTHLRKIVQRYLLPAVAYNTYLITASLCSVLMIYRSLHSCMHEHVPFRKSISYNNIKIQHSELNTLWSNIIRYILA